MSTGSDFVDAAHGLAEAVKDAAVQPADAMRLLSVLAAPVPPDPIISSAIGSAIALVQHATSDLFRRAAVVALARASAAYQPTSADDAAAVRDAVCALLDAEIMIAGDLGQDATFNALREVRSAVSLDLATRGAGLASIITVTSPQPVSAPVLAQRLYRAPGRADELVGQANPIHPAFMPTRFKARSS